MIADGAIPIVPRGVRLHQDRARNRWVLLAPEKTIALDQIGYAILSEVDNRSEFGEIVSRLASKYEAPVEQIRPDVAGFINTLAARRILEVI
ncbi:pyrroloquinoline quinone biosynthesis protein PqqD [Marivivens niveibacter]|uniref:Pyrroloquinoline quinone biosynthesis protein PqqD n=1 Tax=Marivivens niveibacter TaxID=1930667 RepID=A0A251WVP5_9RHOB|nr:pyrroloquinoline quinone biosynthesis peptide chaperone PqqD [Marivivens niveibacter]OUD08331.1 pyrroloquinoline quinone biosynthesis protein PqqD [Marivivens niveibacter]